jgi:hypothetical protein
MTTWLLNLLFGAALRAEEYRQAQEAKRKEKIAASDAAIREELEAAERRRRGMS